MLHPLPGLQNRGTLVTAFLIDISHIQMYVLPSTLRDPYTSELAQELIEFQTIPVSMSFCPFFIVLHLQH